LRWLALVFVLLIAALQYPMWLGKGGWFKVRDLGRDVAKQQEANARLKARNDSLDADVRDLKTGYEAVEERARADLGMIRSDEVFFQLQGANARGAVPAVPVEPAAPPAKHAPTARPGAHAGPGAAPATAP
jgi:cell division protein FtsB